MKKYTIMLIMQSALIFSILTVGNAAAQSKKDSALMEDCTAGTKEFIRTDGLMKTLFDSAYGYVMFPNIGKGGVGVGGAAGNGIVYQKGKIIGKAKMTQVNVGFQFGGQAYREVIFFENKETLDRFKKNNIEFSAQASAVAATAGASANAKYAHGVMIFTQQKGGLMYEASIGGQKFKFTPF
ncbi:MAG TPA: YSC84-related protein [Chitinophagaceae bacterium]|jgi:lipid-binding SYLF domain-containing protein